MEITTSDNKFDYIIAGAGCAGLSLLYRILNNQELKNKKILVLDKSTKNDNDKTWCYWEKETGMFESIVHHKWEKLIFHSDQFTNKFDLKDYHYKMIRGIDFYNHVLKFAKEFNNVIFKYESIASINCNNKVATVKTETSSYSASYVFNSTNLFHPIINTENSLLQHFEGWIIKTKEPYFDEKVGTLMDFRLDQKNGDTFMYVLPTSKTEALIEYTLFSPKLLEKQEYKNALEDYISNNLKIRDYEIVHTEFGVIPMSLANFNKEETSDQIINIGTAGGFTKASSGYTFQFIQKNTTTIVEQLNKGNSPLVPLSFNDKVFNWYDRTLLEVILSKKLTGKEVFSKMFSNVSPEKILIFLDNESNFLQELKIMTSLPILPFLVAGIKQLRR